VERGQTIRIPPHVGEAGAKLAKAVSQLSWELGRDPEPLEVATKLGQTEDYVLQLQDWLRPTVSLDRQIATEDDQEALNLSDLMLSEDDVLESTMNSLLKDNTKKLLGVLSARERTVIELYYGFKDGRNYTLNDIGNTLGVSKERIRQIREEALRKLRRSDLTEEVLDEIHGRS